MKLFSERHGFKSTRSEIQFQSMDEALRNRLWNGLTISYWHRVESNQYGIKALSFEKNHPIRYLLQRLWHSYFKKPFDTLNNDWDYTYDNVKEYFFGCKWNEVYDFIEFVANEYLDIEINEEFMDGCNSIFKEELAGYRFVGGKITPITSEEEIDEIERALELSDSLKHVVNHLETALNLFADRQSPDYRNSIKESISAVEAMCNLISGHKHTTLGDALKRIKKEGKVKIHPALEDGFNNLYGYTSDADGIRHALLEESDLDFEDAKFMLVSCSAFINYLKVKSSKAGIAF